MKNVIIPYTKQQPYLSGAYFSTINVGKLTLQNVFRRAAACILIILSAMLPLLVSGQCTTGCNQSTTANSMPGTNNFSNTFCITTASTLTYNQNFDMNGGTLCVGPNVTFSAGGGNYNGNWTINNYGSFSRGITLNAGQTFYNYGTFTGSVSLNGGTIVNYSGATFTPSSFNFNGGSFTNNSGGTATFSSSVTVNSGATFVNNGTLSTTGLTLNSSTVATLGGSTTINGNVNNNGTVNIAGLITVTGSYNQNSSGTVASQPGSQCNTLSVSGTIQGQGTYNGSNSLLLTKTLSPSCPSCLVNGTSTAPPGQPANQITGASLTASANTISGTISNPGGSPAATHYIVLRRFGNAVADQPSDYINYSVGNRIGNSTVVAVNPISTLSFSDANIIAAYGCGTYHYAVFPYNAASNCGTYNRTINATNRSSITVASTAGSVGSSTTVCSGNTSGTLTLSGYTGSIIRWEYAVSPFSSWTAISNTSATYTSGALTQTTQFRAVVNAGTSCSNANSTAATITVNTTPTAPSGTGASRCGTGSVTLTATPGAGETIDWYTASSGGTAVLTGNSSYTTGALSATTIYYAEARNTSSGCVSVTRTAVTATITPAPSVTLSNFPSICAGTTSLNLSYTSPVNSPDQYSIDWSNAANAAGMADVGWTTLSGGTIPFTGLTSTAGTYAATILVRNSSNGCQTDVSNGAVVTCGTAVENGSLTLTAPASGVFTGINFASYGTPTGSCGSFATSSCHSATSLAVVQAAALGNNSFTLNANNATFGDPCVGTVKKLYIEALSTAQVLNIYAIPTVVSTTAGSNCGTGTVTLSATASSGATIDWYAAATGGTALATATTSYTTGSISASTTYYAEARNTSAGCLSASRTAVTATINAVPSAPTATNNTRCGDGSVTLTATPGAGETIDWYASASGGTALATGSNTYTTGTLSTTTTYYAEARNSTSGCVSATRTAVTATVNPSPSVSLAAFSAICSGTTSTTLTYTSPVNSPDQYSINWSSAANAAGIADVSWTSLSGGTITVSGLTTTAGSYAANIYVRNSATGCQTDVSNGAAVTCGTVAENATLTLTAPGSGVFTNINFASYGTPTGSCGSFATSSCHAAGSLTIVQNAALGRNSFTITANNATFGDPCVSIIKKLYVEAVSSIQILTINAAPTVSSPTGAARCNAGVLTISATPSAGAAIDWYAASSGGTALASGSNTYTTPSLSSTTTYYAGARNTTTGCLSTARTAVTATINSYPAAPSSAGNSRCGTGTITLTATPGAGETIDWYAAASGGAALVTGNTSYTTPSISSTTTYYAEARNSTTGCISQTRTAVAATVNSVPAVPAAGNASRCGTGTVVITATPGTGETIDWYAASSGGTALVTGNTSYTTPSISGTTSYYATARNSSSGCTSSTRTTVTATINTVPAAPTAGNNSRCGTGTVALTATPGAGVTVDWYAAASGGTALLTGNSSFTTPSISTTTSYYAEGRNSTSGCLSTTRTTVTATVTAPAISSFTPVNAGPGMSVVITGTNFTGATAVSFGGTAATSFTVNSATQITAVVSTGSTGNVAVTTACGTATSAGFTYYPAPTITSFTPSSGYIGNTITITGTNFTGATSVSFGGTAAASFTVVSSTTITAVLNTGATGSVAVTTPGGTATKTGFTYIQATVWAGTLSNSWSTAGNWNNGVPTSSSLVVIPPVETYPTLSGNQTISSLSMDTSTQLSIAGSNTLTVTGNLTSNGIVSGTGKITMGGSSAQTISGTTTINNIAINNSTGVSIASGSNMLSITGMLTPTSGTLTTNGNLTLKSTAAGTAMVAQGAAAGNYISGNVIFERYIPSRRAWRLISYPFNSSGAPTINASVQEGAGGTAASNPNPGYGTHITGGATSNGFDANPSGNPSMKELSGSSWIGISTTNQPITNKPGYFIFVRGSRANNLAAGTGAAVDNTTLRGTGSIKQGNQSLTLSASGWQIVGNPFPSPVNLLAMATTNSAVINNNFKFWDPKLGGSNNVGGYVTASYNGSSYDYAPTPASSISEFVQSGAAFFVDAKGAATLAVNEAHKSTGGSDNVFRPASVAAKLFVNLKSVNSDGTQPVVDGVMVGYDENYDDSINEYDAGKLPSSTNENLSVKRNGTLLSIERRKAITTADTIYLNMNYLKVKSYQLELNANSFETEGLTAFLEDAETNTFTPVNLSGSTLYDFSINMNSNINRFRIVFRKMIVLPVTITSITAARQQNNVAVTWKVQQQANVASYELERGADGNNFTSIATIAANNNSSAVYNHTDIHPLNGINYYRVKMIDRDGQFKYSSIVQVMFNNKGTISIFPNPIENNTVQLQMAGLPKGKYSVSIYNANGQRMCRHNFDYNGTDAVKAIRLSSTLPKGIFNATITAPADNSVSLKFSVQ